MYVLDRICKTCILTGLVYWASHKLGLVELVRNGLLASK